MRPYTWNKVASVAAGKLQFFFSSDSTSSKAFFTTLSYSSCKRRSVKANLASLPNAGNQRGLHWYYTLLKAIETCEPNK